MYHSNILEIGGIRFALTCKDSVTIQEPNPAYQSFFGEKDKDSDTIDIKLHLDLENVPKTEGMTKIFDTEQSWSMFFDGNTYCLRLASSDAHDQSFIFAESNREFTDASVYCSGKFINHIDDETIVSNPLHYPLDQILLMYILVEKKGVILHAAGVEINKRAYVFPGTSGAGKSTLSKLFLKNNNTEVLSDDRIVVRKIGDTFQAFGTPWPGEAGIAQNKNFPLEGIFFIHHGTENSIKEITRRDAIEKLLPVSSIPWYDEKTMSNILLFCEDLVSHIPTYNFYFTPDTEVINFWENFVSA